MKRSSIIEARRAKVSPEVRRSVNLSFSSIENVLGHPILQVAETHR